MLQFNYQKIAIKVPWLYMSTCVEFFFLSLHTAYFFLRRHMHMDNRLNVTRSGPLNVGDMETHRPNWTYLKVSHRSKAFVEYTMHAQQVDIWDLGKLILTVWGLTYRGTSSRVLVIKL